MKLTKPLAEGGMIDAQENLGLGYYNGEGVEVSKEKAIYWFMKAQEQGALKASHYLGAMYCFADGVERDLPVVVRYLQSPADNGNPNSLYLLDECYFQGGGMA